MKIVVILFMCLLSTCYSEMLYPLTVSLPEELQHTPPSTPIPIKKTKKQLYIELQFIEIAKNELKKLSLPLPVFTDPFSIVFNLNNSVSIETEELQGTLETLLQNGSAQLLASPQLLTKEEAEATITIGDKIPYVNTTFNGQYYTSSLNMIDSGIVLTTRPSIIDETLIDVDIDTSVSSVKLFKEYATGSYPILSTRHLSSTVTLQHKKMTLIGAIFQKSERDNESKPMFFKNLPFLKKIKTTSNRENDQTTILIFMKIEILDTV